MKACSGVLQALLLENGSGTGNPDHQERSASAARAYEKARAECASASARLNQYLITRIVAAAPDVRETPDP
jgi:hypothetical protein